MASSLQEIAITQMPAPSLLDLNTFEDIDFPFRPMSYNRSINPRYSNPQAFGTASNPLHYNGTDNQIISLEFETLVVEEGDYEKIDDFIRFLEAALVPAQLTGLSGSRRTDPALYLFEWPGEIVMTCKITKFSDVPSEFFQQDGRIRKRKISIELTEIVDGVLSKREVRDRGSKRAKIFT